MIYTLITFVALCHTLGDALAAACLANRFAEELIEDRRPAFRIEVRRSPWDTSDR